MKIFSLYRVELRRLCLSKPIWLIAILCLCAPLLGYSVYIPTASTVMTGLYIANPVITGATFGAVFWAVIVIIEANRLHRNGTDSLTDSMTSPVSLPVARMLAMMTITAAVTGLCALVYLPYTATKLDYLFTAGFYFNNFFVFMLLTWWISILFAEGFYQITRRIDLSLILYALLCYFSFSKFAMFNYFMRWLNPLLITYSDGFASLWPLRMGLYTRLLWVCIAMGVWLLSLLCIRKYQNNLFLSFIKGLKKVFIPILAAAFAVSGVFLWKNQPFIDHGPNEWIYNDVYGHGIKAIGNTHFSIVTNPITGTIWARAEYDIRSPYNGESSLMLNPGYDIISMTYGGEEVDFRTVNDEINGRRTTYFTLPNDKKDTLIIEYGGFPTQVRAHKAIGISDTIDTEYVSLGGETIVPWLNDYIIRGKKTIDITIPDNLTPFLNYAPVTDFVQNKDGTKTWTAPYNHSIMDFTAANFVVDTFTAAGIEIDFAYGEAYHSAVKENNVDQAIMDVFEYCTEHYGELIFAEGKHVLLLQSSSMTGGGYALPGFVNWFENVISPNTLIDTDRGASANEVFIHEMVHQWWGGLGLTCANEEIWSAEGLTVYTTYRIVKEKYGTLYANEYYVDVWQEAVDSQNRNFYNRYPEYLEMLPERYQADLMSANRSTNHYSRMPLMILKAEELVGGEEKMDEILAQMYADIGYYENNNFIEGPFSNNKPFTFQDFLNYCGLTEEELYLE